MKMELTFGVSLVSSTPTRGGKCRCFLFCVQKERKKMDQAIWKYNIIKNKTIWKCIASKLWGNMHEID